MLLQDLGCGSLVGWLFIAMHGAIVVADFTVLLTEVPLVTDFAFV